MKIVLTKHECPKINQIITHTGPSHFDYMLFHDYMIKSFWTFSLNNENNWSNCRALPENSLIKKM